MFRYMAFSWDAVSTDQSAVAQTLCDALTRRSATWREVFRCRGLAVFCADVRPRSSDIHVLSAHAGVVLGTLFEYASGFEYHAPRTVTALDEQETAQIAASSGRDLMTRYWGRYVAFLHDAASGTNRVLRDPTGHLPCFCTRFEQVTVVFSCIADCLATSLLRFTVNWRYLEARVANGVGLADESALNGVSEIYGGECITLGQGKTSRTYYWHPARILESEAVEDSGLAARALRATTRSCVHAWASCYEGILHNLSGGLDSSIVLSCLGDAPTRPAITCVTYSVPDRTFGERPYARLLTERVGCEHLKYERDPKAVRFADLLQITPAVNPSVGGCSFLELSRFESRIARETGASAITTGHGGDALFGSGGHAEAAVDYVRRHGIRWPLVKHAAHVANRTKTSIWKALSHAVRAGLSSQMQDLVRSNQIENRKLLSSSLLDAGLAGSFVPHPWYRCIGQVPPGAMMLVMDIAMPVAFYDPLLDPAAAHAETVCPLLAQPLIELCLRIPNYIHLHEGRDRGLARRAFEPDVPREILWRQWKDSIAGFGETVFMTNLELARELLIDGTLVQRGLLDGHRLAAALSGHPAKSAGFVAEIFDYLVVESWARMWSSPTASWMRMLPEEGQHQRVTNSC